MLLKYNKIAILNNSLADKISDKEKIKESFALK